MGLAKPVRTLAALLLAAAVAAAVPASARMHAPYRGHRIIAGAAAPPLDGLAAASGAYSFRKLKSSYAGPAIRIRRASDNLETDINFLGCTGFTGCPIDIAAANAHCSATSCFIRTWYDQSGNARDLVQTTAANQPQLIFNCIGTQPCLQTTTSTQTLASVASVTPATGVVSLSVVFQRTAGTAAGALFRQNGGGASNRVGLGAANVLALSANTSVVVTAADGAWHAAQGIINGASSRLVLDGAAPVTGSLIGSLAAGAPGLVGAATTTANQTEAIVWDAYAMTPEEVAVLTANQRGFWAF